VVGGLVLSMSDTLVVGQLLDGQYRGIGILGGPPIVPVHLNVDTFFTLNAESQGDGQARAEAASLALSLVSHVDFRPQYDPVASHGER